MAGRLVAKNITKRFGPLVALDDISIEFSPGEIHAVLGENGAGKSTLMNILAGFMVPLAGIVTIDGKSLPLGHPQKFREMGVEMVHQHFTLVPNFTVAENLALAKIKKLARWIDVTHLTEHAFSVGKNLGWTFDPYAKVGTLPVGTQQRIEILKCLAGDASVIIFDEPTAVLTPDEVLDLIRVLKLLRDSGKIVILIAHKLSEVMATADRVTVLRGGKFVATAPITDVDENKLAHWMVGDMPPIQTKDIASIRGEGLEIDNLRVLGDRKEEAVRGVSLKIGKGEIVGIAGVDGNGQVEFAEALALIRPHNGKLSWQDDSLANPKIAYIPQDRQEDGLALSMSVGDNLMIEGQHRSDLKSGLLLDIKKMDAWCEDLVRRFEIRISNLRQPVSDLSGGNQQKIVVSRNLDQRPDLLVAVNPTRGLDVRATRYVHDQITSARDAGTAVALFSTDLDELALIADRIVFLSRGSISEGQTATSLVGGSN
jgi:ABC-type uncharacterized transport system ATPase subunit